MSDLFTLTIQPSDLESVRWRAFSAETSTLWSSNPEYSSMILRAQQQYATDMLNAKGHVFLNELCDSLGLARTALGQLVGWTRQGSRFGVYFGDQSDANADGNFLLNFNFEGIIYDKVEF